MTDWPNIVVSEDDTPLFLNTSLFDFIGMTMRTMDTISAPVSTTWVANLAIYMPFVLRYPYTVRRFFWINGATLTGPPNVDVGIFAPDGTKLCSTGNVAQSGTSSVQFATVSGSTYRIAPGRYWLGLSNSAAVADMFCYGGVSVGAMRGAHIMQQATANPLPASATFAAAANALLPYCGFTRTASGF